MSGSPIPSGFFRKELESRKRTALLLSPLVLLALLLFHFREEERVPLVTAMPAIGEMDMSVSAIGTVVPTLDFPARASFSGMVEKVFVKLGQRVSAGQMLVELKDQYAPSRLAAARADLDAARVSRDNVERGGSQEDRIAIAAELLKARTEQTLAASALETLKRLQERGSASDAEVAAAVGRLQSANDGVNSLEERAAERYSPSDIASWRERVQAQEASVKAERVSYSNAHIGTPIAGTVYDIQVAPYDFVQAGASLVSVADLTRLSVRADFDEIDLPRLQAGQRVTITWEGDKSRSWHGRIVATPLAVGGSGIHRTARLTMDLDGERGALPLNTAVTVVAVVAKRDNALTIPREALHTENGTHFVFCVVKGRLVRTPVTTGLLSPMRAEILSGIRVTDKLALHTVTGRPLTSGLKVAAD